MLFKLYYRYKKSPTQLQELKTFGEMYERSIPKPDKSYGTWWIAHKLKKMETILQNYGIFMQHLQSLAQTNSEAFKRAELEGWGEKMNAGMLSNSPSNLPPRTYFRNPLNANPTKLPTNCFSVFDHFVKLTYKGLKSCRITEFNWSMSS